MSRLRRLRALAAVTLALGAVAAAPPASGAASGARVPTYAYFYQWYDRRSWDRAKQDLPQVGRYSSSDERVLETQLRQAKAAGLTGLLTSWKSTPVLDQRLDLLLRTAQRFGLQVGVVYEALDFHRRPLPVATVQADLVHLVTRWGSALSSQPFGRPVVVWTGTEQYPTAQVAAVRAALRGRALLLAAAKQVSGYERLADVVDGEAYYWSSADPSSDATTRKLRAMATAVHAHHGTWIAPAAPGFDATALGHRRVIPRDGGATLRRSLDNAFGSSPDAVGVISWNEWSESTYVEPGKKYGRQDLDVLTRYLHGAAGTAGRASAHASWGSGRALLVLALVVVAVPVAAEVRRRRQGPSTRPWRTA